MSVNIWDYYESDFKIVTINPIVNGKCGCGDPECEMAGKHPTMKNWQIGPAWSEQQIEVFDKHTSRTGFGVLVNGCLVIDIDPRNGGDEGYKQLCDDTGIDYKKESNFVVATGGGGWHIYFKAPKDTPLVSHIKQYKGIDFKSSGFVIGAGSMHISGMMYEEEKGHPEDIGPAPEKLVKLLEKSRYESQKSFSIDGEVVDEQKIQDMLDFIDPDCDYEDWLHVGMAIHDETCGEGFDLWDAWSSNGSKYNQKEMDFKWHSFGKSPDPVTIGTLIRIAEDNGYQESVTFDVSEADIEKQKEIEEQINTNFDLLDTSWVDLEKPPGLTGQIRQHIIESAQKVRKNLSTAAALQIMSNCLGMQYTSKIGTSLNLYTFCIAPSNTGKNHIIKDMMDGYMRTVGLKQAYFDEMKSAQEVTRNLLAGQAACYCIDEFGLELEKIVTSKNDYTRGLISKLLSGYSNSGDHAWSINGDDMRKELQECKNRIALANKSIDENEHVEINQKIADFYQRRLEMLTNVGLVNRHITLIGTTTPSTFLHLMTQEQVESGFIGRAMIFEDKETVVRAQLNKKSKKVPEQIKNKLVQLVQAGSSDPLYDPIIGQIIWDKPQVEIPVDDEVFEAMEQLSEFIYQWELQESERKNGGLEAMIGRAYESALKVAQLIALGDGCRVQLKHIQWAFALAKKDIENKLEMVRGDVASKRKDKGEELLNRISSRIDDDGWTVSVAVNRLKKYKQEDVQKAFDYLVAKGFLEQRNGTNTRGPKVVKYHKIKDYE